MSPGRKALWIVLGLATLGVFGLAAWIYRFGRRDQARAADAIVVLGAKVRSDGTASAALTARVEHAVFLHRRGLASRLVFCGGKGEAAAASRIAVALGVPREACLLEEQSRDTWENAREGVRLLRAQGLRTALLVSDGYHLFRARQAFRREGYEAWPSPTPLQGRALTRTDLLACHVREAFALLARPDALLQ